MQLKPIPGWPDYAGTDGHIWSLRTRWASRPAPYPRRSSNNKSGYPTVRLSKNKVKKTLMVHRLVCEAFHGPCPERHETSHKNGIYSDTRPSNLCWETKSQNQQRRKKHKTHDSGTSNTRASFDSKQLADIRKRLQQNERPAHIARLYGVCDQTIHNIKKGRHYRHE